MKRHETTWNYVHELNEWRKEAINQTISTNVAPVAAKGRNQVGRIAAGDANVLLGGILAEVGLLFHRVLLRISVFWMIILAKWLDNQFITIHYKSCLRMIIGDNSWQFLIRLILDDHFVYHFIFMVGRLVSESRRLDHIPFVHLPMMHHTFGTCNTLLHVGRYCSLGSFPSRV